MNLLLLTGILLFSYLLGSVPVGHLLVRAARGVNITDYGSGKTGMTNVLRILGLRASLVVFAADFLKGAIVVLLARLVLSSALAEALAALAAVLGHDFSIYIRFRGGRGVTTSLGAMVAISWMVGIIAVFVFLVTLALYRYVSLGSILGTASAFVVLVAQAYRGVQPVDYLIFAWLALFLILFQHRDNLERLWAGTERKLGERVSLPDQKGRPGG